MDHERVNISHSSISCGVMQLSRISEDDIDGVLYNIGSRLYHPSRGDPVAFFVYSNITASQANGDTSAIRLNKKIRELDLGRVVSSDPYENPRTGNMIVVYTWAINHINFKDWYVAQRLAKLRKVGT